MAALPPTAVITSYVLNNLSTTFTPPSGCLGNTFLYEFNDQLSTAAKTGVGHVDITRYVRASCYPTDFQVPYLYQSGEDGTSTLFSYASYYAPAVCPSGYTSAASSQDQSLGYTYCCPMVIPPFTTLFFEQTSCQLFWNTEVSSPTTLTVSPPIAYISNSASTTLGVYTSVTLVELTVTAAPVLVANSLVKLTSSLTLTSAMTKSSTSRGLGATSTANGDKLSGLSSGAEARIGTSVVIGAILVALVIF